MGLNKNHEVEEFNGIRCAIVEKSISKERVDFLKSLLEYNKYKVEVMVAPPPKVAVAVAAAGNNTNNETVATPLDPATATAAATDSGPSLYNIGVTDLMFNTTNAIFGRLLKVPGGHIATLAYWNQKEKISNDEIPYYDKH